MIHIQMSDNSDNMNIVKPKRGRRTKKEMQEALGLIDSSNEDKMKQTEDVDISSSIECSNIIDVHVPKKRGRKPKGGKIVVPAPKTDIDEIQKQNVILHLKCSTNDIQGKGDYNSNFIESNIDSFSFSTHNQSESYMFEIIDNPVDSVKNKDSIINNSDEINSYIIKPKETGQRTNIDENDNTKELWKKLKILEQNLHINNISDKKSSCFWCTYDFDNPPVYIPKFCVKDTYHVYGCFCTPECATAHLMQDNLDSSTIFERYYLLNNIYSKIYNYTKNIKPAPDPHYMLDKYYGNLTIQEYRNMLKSERLFLIVDKPITRILPEFHEDNEDFIINQKIIPSNNYQLKPKLPQKNKIAQSKSGHEPFGTILHS
jgi:hypothetical protein